MDSISGNLGYLQRSEPVCAFSEYSLPFGIVRNITHTRGRGMLIRSMLIFVALLCAAPWMIASATERLPSADVSITEWRNADSIPRYGLFYPLYGQTFCTGIELELAMRMGCRRLKLLDVRYFPFLRHEDCRPVLPFADHLGMLNRVRATHPKGSLPNMLYKEMANSLYGKLAQGIRERTRLNF